MKNWRVGVWFVGVLVGAYTLDYLFSCGLSALNLVLLEAESSWWSMVRQYAIDEILLWVLRAALFVSAGAVLALRGSSLRMSVVAAVLLGYAFATIHVIEGPRILYSHAPLWLWALAWAALPPIASAIGVVLFWRKIQFRRATRALAA